MRRQRNLEENWGFGAHCEQKDRPGRGACALPARRECCKTDASLSKAGLVLLASLVQRPESRMQGRINLASISGENIDLKCSTVF